MKVYRLKKDWSYVIGNNSIGFHMGYKKGDRFFKPSDESEFKTIGPNYYPENGSYPVAERENSDGIFKFVDEYFELIEETDKPKEYYTDKKYSQYDVDNILKTKNKE